MYVTVKNLTSECWTVLHDVIFKRLVSNFLS